MGNYELYRLVFFTLDEVATFEWLFTLYDTGSLCTPFDYTPLQVKGNDIAPISVRKESLFTGT